MIKALVIDDNARDRERCAAALAAGGIDVVAHAGAAPALADVPDAAVVIVLWELTGDPTGPELLTRLRRDRPRVPVIVVSGLLDSSRAARARALGAADFLLKPFDAARLRAAVRGVLSQAPAPLLASLRARLIGSSPPFLAALDSLARVIPHAAESVLLIGENGTGKELLARAVHDLGPPDAPPWVAVNVASIPPTLLEATLFGHEPGAYTDARSRRVGVFEECGTGTLFLDEIGELDPTVQAKLLRVIQERQFRRLGGSQELPFRARLVCATNRDLIAERDTGRFRADLYYRIAAHEIRIPPLRNRGDDVWLLVDYFLGKHGHGRGRPVALSREARQLLTDYPFPGNVRELEDLIKHALIRCPDGDILPYHLPVEVMDRRGGEPDAGETLRWPERLFALPQKEAVAEIEREFDRLYLPRKLREAGGNVTQAARAAGIDPKTLRRKWADAGLGPLAADGGT